MATKLGTPIADFTTQLATAITVAGTTASLQSATDDDGVALPSGRYFFTLDGANSYKEHISADLSGTSLTNIKSVSRQGVETTGVARAHRIGASVTITDFAHIKYINDLVSGTTTLNASAPLGYDGTASLTTPNQLATKAYVDGVAIAGAPDSSTTAKGITKMSVAPASGTNPIAVGDNDPRVPTQGENDALVGNSGTPSSTNKYVTEEGSAGSFGDGSDGDVTISAGTTTLTRDMFYNSLVVTGTLKTDGYRVFVKGTISGAGTVLGATPANGGAGVSGSSGGTAGAASAAAGTGPLKGVAGSAGGVGGNGSSGGVGVDGTAGRIGAAPAAGGAGGNSTGGNNGGAGGAAGANAEVSAFSKAARKAEIFSFHDLGLVFRTPRGAGGGGGGGENVGGGNGGGGGGGGGASGAVVFLAVKTWTGTFTIQSVGGAGGAGGDGGSSVNGGGGGGGGGGAGGTSIVVYGTKTWTGSYTLTGGAGGAGGAGTGSGAGGNTASNGSTGTSYELSLSTFG